MAFSGHTCGPVTEFEWLQGEVYRVIGDDPRGIPPGNIGPRLSRHAYYLKVRPSWVKLKTETRAEMVVSALLKLLQGGRIKFVIESSRLGMDHALAGDLPIDIVKVRKLGLLDALARV